MKRIVFVSLLCIILFSGCSAEEQTENHAYDQAETMQGEKEEQKSEKTIDFHSQGFFQPIKDKEITHIHGIGYPNQQSGLFLATHHGLKVYSKGKWFETVSNNHDFMGFQATNEGFYSSGHPEKGSELSNPLGLISSSDFGQTLNQLSFYGESDFHYMTASYNGNAIYVVNEHPNSKLDTGLFYTVDKGKTWTKSKLGGLPAASAHSIAVHPELDHIIGISTPEGLYLSHDFGNNFSLISDSVPVFAFAIKSDSLLYVVELQGKLKLVEQSLESDDGHELTLPKINNGDTILYLAVNPIDDNKFSFSTLKGSVWTTTNYGEDWTNIVNEEKITTNE